MHSISPSLASIVQALVPQSRQNEALRNELVGQSEEILKSHIGSKRDGDIGSMSELIRRHLAQTRPDLLGTHQLSSLLTRLGGQSLLTRKESSLQFLHSLASSSTQQGTPLFLPILPILSSPASKDLSKACGDQLGHTHKADRAKAHVLKEYRRRNNIPIIPESPLLRDCLYALQGISGEYIRFSVEDRETRTAFFENEAGVIPQATRVLLHRLCEVGHLYSRIVKFVTVTCDRTDAGMIEQSLCYHLHQQLTEYYRLIAVLESHVSASKLEEADKPVQPLSTTASGLTLRRLDVWIEEWRLRMRMMSICVEASRDAQGGALVSLIHGYTDNGDPFIRGFTDSLLEDVSKPFFSTLQQWLFCGELHDPFFEFFVILNPELSHYTHGSQGILNVPVDKLQYTRRPDDDVIVQPDEGGRRLWQDKYRFRKEMLPSFVGEAFGKKIFSTGKSLNFIRYSCHDSDWVATRDAVGNTGRILRYSDIPGLEQSIDDAYKVASQRLLEAFFEKFRLLDHLNALKHYLMLGYGDFADQLLEALGPSLSRPANTLYRHNLTAILEAAIRSSNAQKDSPDVLRRLDARMLEYSHGEIGWDVFTLEYKVDAPLDTILHPESMLSYMKTFNHLWKLRRLEAVLTRGWTRVVGGARTFLKVADLEIHWHRVRIVMSEMIQFVRQVQAWCQLEVIECSWKHFLDFINKREGDLDALIEAHQVYLDRIVSKVLLRSSKAGREDNVLLQAQDLFQIILDFRDSVDNFYNATLAEAARLDSHKDGARGVITETESSNTPQAISMASDTVGKTILLVQSHSSSFSEKAQAFVHSLQVHSDPDCRFLAIRLSFSDFYKSKNRMS